MKQCLFLFMILFQLNVFAQSKNEAVIIGRVSDQKNIPLIAANIIDEQSGQGTSSNKNGNFILVLPKQNSKLIISYVGYYPIEKIITVEEMNRHKSDTLYLNFIMEPKIESLPDFTFQSEKTELAYKKTKSLIIDYEFHEKGLLLLLEENKNYFVRLVDEQSQTLYELKIPKHPNRFFIDCLGNLSIIYHDSTYQIFENNNSIVLLSPNSIQEFISILLPCVCSTPDFLIMQQYGLHNQSVIYTSIHRTTKKQALVIEITDKISMSNAIQYYFRTQAEAAIAPGVMDDNDMIQHKIARDAHEQQLFYEVTLSNPVYHPLIQLNDSIYIFDHIHDSVFVYDQENKLRRKFFINYHYKTGWKNELISDADKKNIYAKFIRSGITYLLKIDLITGKIEKEYKLNFPVFPEKIKIKNGYVYYLYRDKKDLSVTNVYRQMLE